MVGKSVIGPIPLKKPFEETGKKREMDYRKNLKAVRRQGNG